MTTAIVIGGIALIVVVLRDILHELFHPSASGDIAQIVMRGVWRLFRRFDALRNRLALAGPLIFVAVLVVWTMSLALGWALVYWPFLPDHFQFASPLSPPLESDFADALYISLVSLSTLGFGDITPTTPWLRVAIAIEGFVGFALLTAGISWILTLYPVLTRRRALANRINIEDEAVARAGVAMAAREPGDATRLLDELTMQLIVLRADLMLSPLSYYFHDGDPDVSLARALPRLVAIARELADSDSPAVRHGAATLAGAVHSFAAQVATAHLRIDAATEAILAAYAREHPYRERRR